MIPLYGFLEGDTIGLLVLAREEQTVREIAERLQRSARVRVAPAAQVVVVHGERELAPELSVRQAGLEALDRFDVRQRRSPG